MTSVLGLVTIDLRFTSKKPKVRGWIRAARRSSSREIVSVALPRQRVLDSKMRMQKSEEVVRTGVLRASSYTVAALPSRPSTPASPATAASPSMMKIMSAYLDGGVKMCMNVGTKVESKCFVSAGGESLEVDVEEIMLAWLRSRRRMSPLV